MDIPKVIAEAKRRYAEDQFFGALVDNAVLHMLTEVEISKEAEDDVVEAAQLAASISIVMLDAVSSGS